MNDAQAARELVAAAKELSAAEFTSPEALKRYLKEHPDSDKSKHTVKKRSTDPWERMRQKDDNSDHPYMQMKKRKNEQGKKKSSDALVAGELIAVAKDLTASRKWVTKLISPQGRIFWEAYGPMVKDIDDATRFPSPKIAEKAAMNRFGRSGTAFWNSEREHESRMAKKYKDWDYEVENAPSVAKDMTAAFKDSAYIIPEKRMIVLSGIFEPPRGTAARGNLDTAGQEAMEDTSRDLLRSMNKVNWNYQVVKETHEYRRGDFYAVVYVRGRHYDPDDMAGQLSSAGFVVTM